MEIHRYTQEDEAALFGLMQREGEEWSEYHTRKKAMYAKALANSITYVAYKNDVLCGYCRCRNDDGFGVYIYDLLVDKKARGKRLGHALMTRVCADFPQDTVYVMSDVDEYYQKQGYQREGSIFKVAP
ncbi:GNAT family N-acetyltransferase [Ruminococcaceae bacterium OttesenSCG-928-A16]|nr:GNAT family N-acetyltransferase [Ruminococcaceae bacterium OttesenSCG-928-A16]